MKQNDHLIKAVFIVLATLFILSCNAVNISSPISSRCNDDVLRKTLDTPLSPMAKIEDVGEFPFKHPKEGSLLWRIYERSSYGCVVESSAEVNGERIIGTVWFVDLELKRVFPDNSYANIFFGLGDNSVSEGIPLP